MVYPLLTSQHSDIFRNLLAPVPAFFVADSEVVATQASIPIFLFQSFSHIDDLDDVISLHKVPPGISLA